MKRIISLTLVFLMMITFVPVLNAQGANLIGIFINDGAKSKELSVDFKKSGGKLEAKVYTEGITNLQTRARKDTVFYQQDDYNNNLKPNVENKGDYFLYTCTIPKNETESDVVWTIEFKGEKWSSGGKINVRVSGKEDSGEPSPEPNPGPEPNPNPTPTPGEDTNKAQILGMDMGDGKLVKTFTENIKNASKTYTAIVKTKNVDKLQVKYTSNGKIAFNGVNNKITNISKDEFKVELTILENFAKSCKKYEISIGHGELPGDYSDGIKLNINIDGTENKCTLGGNDEDPIERVATISRVSDTEDIKDDVLNMEIDSKEQDKKVYLTLINGDILKDGELDAIVKKDTVMDPSIKTTFTGSKNARVASIPFPENTSDKDITYEVTFMIKNKLQNGKKLTIVQKKKSQEEKEASIELFTLTNENIPLSGGSVRASVFGENIDTSKLSVKVYDGDSDISGSMMMSPFIGREDVATSDITFKESVEDKSYTLKLYYAGEEKMTANLVQNKYGSNNDSINFQANRIFKAGNKIITEFTHDIFEAYPNALKDNTEIAFDGTADIEKHEGKYVKAEPKFEKLKDADTVEIQGNKIIVTLSEEREFKNAPKIRFGFRTFKNPEGIYNGRKDNRINSYFIQDGNGIILSADFISDKVLTSQGGDVELKIHGIELSDDETNASHTRVKIIKMENLKKDSEQTEVPYTLEGNGSEQILKFTLPENNSNRTESYTVLLSTDGRVYVSDVNATANDRANLLVLSVLPEGKNKDDMTLGFARIQSYGTSGGSTEKPDLTHTTPPLGQESKKTWVTIYGTNFKNPMTKIRAKAEVPAGSGKYVYWYPVNEGTQDSGDKFIMVGVSKGLYGKDNVQMLEVIAPRGYRGNITYTYEIAIDGVNYDTELTTSVLLLDDGEDQGIRKKHEEFVRELSVKYQDESGNEIKTTENMHVMKNMSLRVVGIDKAPEIDGYKYKELKGLNKDLNKELAKIDMLRKLAENGTISEDEKQELAKLEQWVKDHKDIEFDTVIGDIEELVFVYEKLEQDEYINIPDPKFLKVINKNLDPNRPDNQKVTKKEMESLTLISHWLDNDGKPGIQDDANKSILGTPKSLEGTDEFKFMISYGIKSIEGIQYAKNLKKLKLNENEISDISYLKDLDKLEYLEISRNRIVDIKPLEGLTNLTFLKLYNNWIEDLTPIKGLTNLTGLDVHNNVRQKMIDGKRVNSHGISDISMLKDLTKLNFLDVSANSLKDATVIKMFPDIKDMDLSGNHIETYEGLGEYIAGKYMQAQMGIGSLNFWAQSVTEDEPIKVSVKELEFDNKYKGYKELFTTLIKKMNEDDAPSDEDALQMAQDYTMIETNLDEVDASYDLKTNKIKLNLSDDFLKENKDKLVDAQIKFTFAYAYQWSLNVKLDLREEKSEPQPEPKPQPEPEPDPQPVPDYDVVVRPRPGRRPDTNGKKEEIKPEEKKEVKTEEKQEVKAEENTVLKPIAKEVQLDVKEPTLPVNLKDIPNDDFGVAIKNMVSRGVLVGTSEKEFSPDLSISRAMVTEVFRRLATDKNAGENVKFEDVKDDAWYAESVKWAAFMNIIKGYENGTFKPNQKVTRQEFAIMICRMLDAFKIELPKGSKVDLTQFGSLENWSKDAVIRVLQEGLLKIEPNGELGPKSLVSRKELALVLDKIVKFTMSK